MVAGIRELFYSSSLETQGTPRYKTSKAVKRKIETVLRTAAFSEITLEHLQGQMILPLWHHPHW